LFKARSRDRSGEKKHNSWLCRWTCFVG